MSKIIAVLFLVLLVFLIASCYTTSTTGESCLSYYGSGKCNACYGTGSTREEGKCRTCGGGGKCIACGGSGVYRRIVIPGPVY